MKKELLVSMLVVSFWMVPALAQLPASGDLDKAVGTAKAAETQAAGVANQAEAGVKKAATVVNQAEAGAKKAGEVVDKAEAGAKKAGEALDKAHQGQAAAVHVHTPERVAAGVEQEHLAVPKVQCDRRATAYAVGHSPRSRKEQGVTGAVRIDALDGVAGLRRTAGAIEQGRLGVRQRGSRQARQGDCQSEQRTVF